MDDGQDPQYLAPGGVHALKTFLQKHPSTSGPLEGMLRFFKTNFTFGHVLIQCSLNADHPAFSSDPSRDR